MSRNASEARRPRPDRRKRSKDHNISNHKYTCRDGEALHVIIHMSLQRTAWALLQFHHGQSRSQIRSGAGVARSYAGYLASGEAAEFIIHNIT
jgi:hypothetical protein